MREKMLVVSAHPGDLLWRCSGAVAKHVRNGGTAKVIILTYGTAGEANELMKQPGMTVDGAKEIRNKATKEAAAILGVSEIEFWDMADYPLDVSRPTIYRLAKVLREYHPDFILTHHGKDTLNPDHGSVISLVTLAAEVAGGLGISIEGTAPGLSRTQIFCFEPHTTEFNGFVPNVYVDITDDIETKKKAMACFIGKEPLAESYVNRARIRGQNATSFGAKNCKYAEAYQAVYPFAMSGDFVF